MKLIWRARAARASLNCSRPLLPTWIEKWSSWRVQFWPLRCGKFVEAFVSRWSWFEQQELRVEAWTVGGPYCPLGIALMRFWIGTVQLKKVLGWPLNGTSKEAPDHQIEPIEGPLVVKKRRAQICGQIQRFIKIPTELRRQTRTSTTHTKHKRRA